MGWQLVNKRDGDQWIASFEVGDMSWSMNGDTEKEAQDALFEYVNAYMDDLEAWESEGRLSNAAKVELEILREHWRSGPVVARGEEVQP